MTENIVEFPRHRIVREYAGVEYIEQVKEKSKQNFAESVADDLISALLDEIDNMGIDTTSDSFMKDFSMTVDSLRATVYRTFDVEHHLHSFIDKNVKMINRETGEQIDIEEEITCIPLEEVIETVDKIE
jgi:molecular chaperone GrpE (heat shock protein)